MGNKNQTSNQEVSKNTAGNTAVNSAPSPRNVTLKVDANGNVIEEGNQQGNAGVQSTAGPSPNPQQNNNTGDGLTIRQSQDQELTKSESSQVGNANPQGSNNGVEQPQQMISGGSQVTASGPSPAPELTTDQPPSGDILINTDELISSAQTEIKSGDEEQEARKKKAELLTKAINSRHYFEDINFANAETGEQVGGSRIRYVKDPYGKTVYDYMADETVNQHLGFKIDENDPKDGSIVDKQISIFWKNPAF